MHLEKIGIQPRTFESSIECELFSWAARCQGSFEEENRNSLNTREFDFGLNLKGRLLGLVSVDHGASQQRGGGDPWDKVVKGKPVK